MRRLRIEFGKILHEIVHTFRRGSFSSGHSGIQTHEADVPSALQTRPAPQ